MTIVVPYLNQTLIFEVDTGNDGFFCDSRYAINDKYRYSFKFDYINQYSYPSKFAGFFKPENVPMYFEDQKQAEFCPANMQPYKFGAEAFVPHGTENSNRVFVWNRYYYIMFGNPTTMVFRGDGTNDYPPVTVSFAVSDDGNDIQKVIIPLEISETPAAEIEESDANVKALYELQGCWTSDDAGSSGIWDPNDISVPTVSLDITPGEYSSFSQDEGHIFGSYSDDCDWFQNYAFYDKKTGVLTFSNLNRTKIDFSVTIQIIDSNTIRLVEKNVVLHRTYKYGD